MKPSGFGIIELSKTIIHPEAHAMNKSITQATQNDKQISKSFKRFFTRFHISSALKAANAYKKKREPSCRGLSVSFSADLFQQEYVYESDHWTEYSRFCKRYCLPIHKNDPDQLNTLYNPAGFPDHQGRYCSFGFKRPCKRIDH